MGNENRTITLTGEAATGQWQDKTIYHFTDARGNDYSVWDSDLAQELRSYLGSEAVYDVRSTTKNNKTYLTLDGVRGAPRASSNGTAPAASPVADRIRIAEIASTLALVDLDPQGRVQYLLDICRAIEQFAFGVGTSDERPPDWA